MNQLQLHASTDTFYYTLHLQEDRDSLLFLLGEKCEETSTCNCLICSQPYLRSFQYEILNSILFTNEILFKIGYIPRPNCSFHQDTKETRNHALFTCPLSYSFWMDVIANILNNI